MFHIIIIFFKNILNVFSVIKFKGESCPFQLMALYYEFSIRYYFIRAKLEKNLESLIMIRVSRD